MNVCGLIVEPDLCIGCGVCAAICPPKTLQMIWNADGNYAPSDAGNCTRGCHRCIDACPFRDQPRNEDTLARQLYSSITGIRWTSETGFYLNTYAGYAQTEDFRAQGASGGVARWLLYSALTEGLVDRVVCVAANENPEKAFSYQVLSESDIRSCAKSAYYPVELSEALRTVLSSEARYAIVGLPCFIKAVRLAMCNDRRLQDRIRLVASLACGQGKSKFYAEYLVRKAGLSLCPGLSISFREKDPGLPADAYLFAASTGDRLERLGYQDGSKPPYVTGQFTPAACTFCDDLFGELADVVFMDAWLPRYSCDGRGTNLVLARTPTADALLARGAERGQLHLEAVDVQDVITSQLPALLAKRKGLAARLWMADARGRTRPIKRINPQKPGWWQNRFLLASERLRTHSFQAMRAQRERGSTGLDVYAEAISGSLRKYYRARKTYWYVDEYSRAIQRRVRRLVSSLRVHL